MTNLPTFQDRPGTCESCGHHEILYRIPRRSPPYISFESEESLSGAWPQPSLRIEQQCIACINGYGFLRREEQMKEASRMMFSHLRLSIRKHALLSTDEKEALLRDLEAFHSRLLRLVHPRTLRDDGPPQLEL